ncbi:hypothetical protein LQV63_14260 [Paenibacillus profundus]|uniref:Uncharacterized protein n=1 Tax=Paenibacillus profundus TaxID=1173085 RepID=A0ABS8YJF1_9BACL|nr:hypothetical protein [Paenibacillus profundus]MCE5170475.1 hypothetical protein [Paenibacillus profundus]
MNWIVLAGLCCLFIIALWQRPREKEMLLPARLFLFFMIGSFSFRFIPGTDSYWFLPLGFLLGWWFVAKRSKHNQMNKKIALLFGLVYLILIESLPFTTFSDIRELRTEQQYKQQFQDVTAMHRFAENAPFLDALGDDIQRLRLADSNQDYAAEQDPMFLFRAWVLNQRGIDIPSYEWLNFGIRESYPEYWFQSKRPDRLTNQEYITFGDEGYFGLFKRKDEHSPFHMVLAIEFRGFANGRPGLFSW